MQDFVLANNRPTLHAIPSSAAVSTRTNSPKKNQRPDILLAIKGCALGTALIASGCFWFLKEMQAENSRSLLNGLNRSANPKKSPVEKKVDQKKLSDNYLKVWDLTIDATIQTVQFSPKHPPKPQKVPFLKDKELCSEEQKHIIQRSKSVQDNTSIVCLHPKQIEKRNQKEGIYRLSSLDWVLGRAIQRVDGKTNKLFELNPGTINKNNQMIEKNSNFKVSSCEILKNKLLMVKGVTEKIKPLIYGEEYCSVNSKEILFFHNSEKQNYHIARILNTTSSGMWVSEKFSTLLPQENFISNENLSMRHTKIYLASIEKNNKDKPLDLTQTPPLEVLQRTDRLCGTLCIDPLAWRVN